MDLPKWQCAFSPNSPTSQSRDPQSLGRAYPAPTPLVQVGELAGLQEAYAVLLVALC